MAYLIIHKLRDEGSGAIYLFKSYKKVLIGCRIIGEAIIFFDLQPFVFNPHIKDVWYSRAVFTLKEVFGLKIV